MNEQQTAYLRTYGLTEEQITSGSAPPEHRLQIANMGAAKAEPAKEEPETATIEETAAQKAYRAGRPLEQITSAVDRENYDALGGDIFRTKAEPEVPVEAKRAPAAPVEIGPQTEFDIDKISALSAERRNSLADMIRVVQTPLPPHPSLNDLASVQLARRNLAPFVKA
ncbi:hypothetical protein NKH37_11235 [Mesorhizobium sp. M1217]|uniref:hypothetical protein n=1 Tax=Mesorhizobium sp. M1217 TaxID=2957070 RepID=UPI003336A07A